MVSALMPAIALLVSLGGSLGVALADAIGGLQPLQQVLARGQQGP